MLQHYYYDCTLQHYLWYNNANGYCPQMFCSTPKIVIKSLLFI